VWQKINDSIFLLHLPSSAFIHSFLRFANTHDCEDVPTSEQERKSICGYIEVSIMIYDNLIIIINVTLLYYIAESEIAHSDNKALMTKFTYFAFVYRTIAVSLNNGPIKLITLCQLRS
jgi:hypothetical protein